MTQRSSGGAGWGGLFESAGDFTTAYFDRLDKERSFAEQQRQFNEQQANVRAQIKQQEQRDEIDRFDRLDKSLQRMEEDLATRGEYMSDDQRAAYTSFIQAGRSATQSYWAAGDKAGFDAFTQKFGPGKPWGTDATGQPITLDTINASVYENKPRVELKKKISSAVGDASATFAANTMLNPDATPEMKDAARGLAEGRFTSVSEAISIGLSGSATSFSTLKNGLRRTGINGQSLMIVEDVMKTLPPPSETLPDGTPNPAYADYKFLQDKVNEKRADIDSVRNAVAIQQGKGAELQYNTDLLAFDVGKLNFARAQINAKKADATDLGALIREGDYDTLNTAGGRAEYFRVFKDNVPDASDADIESAYQSHLIEAKTIRDERRAVSKAQATIAGNQALASTMDTEQKQILFDALKPFMAGDAVAQRNLESALRNNNTTSAQFIASVLPTMLRLQNSVERNGLLETLATAKGGIGIPAIQAAMDSGLVNQEDGAALLNYANQVKGLWDKGVNVQGMQYSAEYMKSALDKQLSDHLIGKYPKAQADRILAEARAGGSQALVQALIAEGQTPKAYLVGQQGMSTQLSEYEKTQVNNSVQTAVAKAQLPYAALMGSTSARASIQAGLTQISQNLVQRYIAEGGLPFARQVGASGMQTQLSADAVARITNDVQAALKAAQLPYAGEMGEAQAKQIIQAAITDSMTQYYNGQLVQGQTPYAGQLGAATGQANVAEQGLRLRTINSTLSLLDDQEAAQRQSYATAVANGRYEEALAIIKKNNVNLDYKLQQGDVLQSLASIDPKAQLASSIKDPQLKAMYQNAVDLANQQRDLTNQLAGIKAGNSGGGGDDPTLVIQRQIKANLDSIKSIYNRPDVQQHIKALKDNFNITVSVDPVTGMSGIAVPYDISPDARRRAEASIKFLEGVDKQAAPFRQKVQDLTNQMNNLPPPGTATGGTGNGAGGGGGTAGNGLVPPQKAASVIAQVSTPGAKLQNMGFTSDAITAPAGTSHCSMFARQLSAKTAGVSAYGAEMQKYFGPYAVAGADSTLNKFKAQNAIFVNNVSTKDAMSRVGSLRAGDVVFLDYGDKTKDHVAVYDGNGNFVQHSSRSFQGKTVQGNVNTMSVEQFFSRAGNAKVSFGRIGAGTASPSRIYPASPGFAPVKVSGPPRFKAPVAPGAADPKVGRVIPSASGAAHTFSGIGTKEISNQINGVADFMIGKMKYANSIDPWDNQSGFLRAYVGYGKSPENANYVSNVRATYNAKPWVGAIKNAQGLRKDELYYIDQMTDRIAKEKNIDPNLLKALMWNESEWVPGAVRSDKKGGGLGQVAGYFPPARGSGTAGAPPSSGQARTTPAPVFNNTTALKALPAFTKLPQSSQAIATAVTQVVRIRGITDIQNRRQAAYDAALDIYRKSYPNNKDKELERAQVAIMASQLYNWAAQ